MLAQTCMCVEVIFVSMSFWVLQGEGMCPCVGVSECVCAGWHRWLWSEDVINTLGRGISVQEWAPCFSGEVIGKKKPGRTGGGTNTHSLKNAGKYYLHAFSCESQFFSSLLAVTQPSFTDSVVSVSHRLIRSDCSWAGLFHNKLVNRHLAWSCVFFLHRDGEEIRVSVPQVSAPPRHPVCVLLVGLLLLC